MNILETIGVLTICTIFIVLFYKLYRKIFGYSWNSCPNDHDTMTRYGATFCNKCKNELWAIYYMKTKDSIINAYNLEENIK